jgi:hypothetical protein
MNHSASVYVSSIGSEEVDDPLLDRLDAREEAAQTPADILTPPEREVGEPEPDNPFDFTLAKPAAIDLRKLYARLKLPLPAAIEAALGPRLPILLCHGMTPFYKGGQRPTGVWGIGYQATLKEVDAVTVSFLPETRLLEFAKLRQQVTFGLEAGGGF